MQRIFLFAALMIVLGLGLGLAASDARAETIFIVNKTGDHDDGVCDSTDCTLREAVAAAQAGGGGGTVKFDPDVFPAGTASTLDSTLGPLQVYSTLIVYGQVQVPYPGGGTASWLPIISGGRNTQVFVVSSNATLNLQWATIDHGSASSGGAIYNGGGTVNIDRSMFNRNYATNGGAIFNDQGTVNIHYSSIGANGAQNGSSIYNNLGRLTITQSAIGSDNAQYDGGSIYNNSGTLTIANSLLTDSSAANGAGIYNTGTATLINTTVARNRASGGIYNTGGGTVLLKNTILASNAGYNCSGGGITDGGHNLEDGTTCGLNPANNSQPGVDPMFDSIYQLTLQPGSPAIDAGNDAVCAAAPVNNVDRYSFRRPRGPHCDIGAWEKDRATLVVIKRVINDNDGTSSASDFTMNVSGNYASLTSFPGAEAPGTRLGIAPGPFSVTETGPTGYNNTATNCTSTIANEQTITCTLTSDDIAPPTRTPTPTHTPTDTPTPTATYTPAPPVFSFDGFYAPVDNPPTLNVAKAGSVIPVKFSLGGDQGLNILADGYPISQEIACDSDVPRDPIEETAGAGSAGLSYDTATDTYTYHWKTKQGWAGACRKLILRLSDATDHVAKFKLK